MRLGGDEFVIVLSDQPKGTESVSCLLQKLRAAIADPLLIDGHTLRVTGSIGVANYPNDGTDARTLLANADAAMYRAKQIGRDNFQFYTADLNIKARERLLLHEELRNAIARNEFVLFYQPQLDLQTGKIFAVEALIRWRHPKLGLVSPDKFIPMAEQTGLIVPIGDWVLREACRQNKAWQDAGLPRMNVCVNVSARQFNDKTLIAKVVDALQRERIGGQISRTRGDRKPHHARCGGCDRHDEGATRARRAVLDRRFWNRLFQPERVEHVPGGSVEDRQIVHHRFDDKRA